MDLVSALGHCSLHNIDKLSITDTNGNEQSVCVKCRAAGEVKTGRTQIVEDPGEGFNGFTGGKGKITLLDPTHGAAQYDASAKAAVAGRPAVRFGGATLEEIVANAVLNLSGLPMPKDIKEFKKVQKVIKTLQSLVENENG